MHATATLRIQLLGEFRLWVGDMPVDPKHWRLHKAEALVKQLALAPNHRLLRDSVLSQLWPDLDQSAAINNLHQIIHVARQALAQFAPNQKGLVLDGQYVELWPDGPIWVDVSAFESAAAKAYRTQDPGDYRSALSLMSGELLPENRFDDWTSDRRRFLSAAQLKLSLDLARLYEARGDLTAAIDAFEGVLQLDGDDEDAHVGLMRVYALKGERQRALRQYQCLTEALARDLETEPSSVACQLNWQIRSGAFPGHAQPDQASPQSNLRANGKRRGNLPTPITSFIGREEDVQTICKLLVATEGADASTRLLTLTGPGGTGKTRLALHVAQALSSSYPDGVWFVDLGPICDQSQVGSAICSALDLRQPGHHDPRRTLGQFLKEKRILLIVDNCEHLLEASAELVGMLLQASPGLFVVATSREILDIAGEVVYRVSALTTPDPRHWDYAKLPGFDAIRLFISRARDTVKGFALTPENAPAVVAICSELDGIPLAIELAAARLQSLTVAQVAARLNDRFRLLRRKSRSTRSRHETLQAPIDWSFYLLSNPEQVTLRRLSVFAGGCALDAADAIIGEPDQEDVIDHLVRKSLVSFSFEPTPRYKMLETVRQYAAQKLAESGEQDVVRARHLQFFVALARQAEPWLRSTIAPLWLDRLEADLDNIRTGLARALDNDGEVSLELASSLLWFWHIRNHQSEGIEWLRRALKAASVRPAQLATHESTDLRAKGLTALASLLWFTVGSHEARDYLEEGRALLEGRGSDAFPLLATIYVRLGEMEADYSVARGLISRALTMARQAGDAYCVSECLKSLSLAEFHDGQYAQALESLNLAEKSFIMIGDRDGLGTIELYRGHSHFALRKWGDALASYDVARRQYESVSNEQFAHISVFFMGWAQFWMGHYSAARETLEKAMTSALVMGDRLVIARGAFDIGVLDWAEGDRDSATAHIQQSLAIALESGLEAGGGAASQYHLLGCIALSGGDLEHAATYFRQEYEVASRTAEAAGLVMADCGLARVALEQNNPMSARASIDRALSERSRLWPGGQKQRAVGAHALLCASRIYLACGSFAAARNCLIDALGLQPPYGFVQHGLETGPVFANAFLLESVALLCSNAKGSAGMRLNAELEKAALLVAASESQYDCRYALAPGERAGRDQMLAELRDMLGKRRFAAAWRAGRTLAIEAAREQCWEVLAAHGSSSESLEA